MRAGGQTLKLLGTRSAFLILRALAEGPRSRLDLRRAAGSPASSTLRGRLTALEAAGAIASRQRERSLSTLEYELTESGRELFGVATDLDGWLGSAPGNPLALGDDSAVAAIKGLVEGWSAAILSALSAEALSLTELDKRILGANYPTIERCLETMRLAEQVEPGERTRGGTPYLPTPWLRRGIAPLSSAARWEHRHRPEGAEPICRADIDDGLSLISPLMALPSELSGVCQLATKSNGGRGRRRRFLTALVVQDGKLAFGSAYADREPDAWIAATAEGWFSAILDGEPEDLKVSGERRLAEAVLTGVRQALFEHAESELSDHLDIGRKPVATEFFK